MHQIDPTRLDLAREFKRQPFGPHSQDLQKVLKIMRWDDARQRYISVQLRPGGSWYLARSSGGRGHPLEVYLQPEFSDQPSAQWAVFRMRWQMHTGQALALDDDPPLGRNPMLTDVGTVQRPLLGYADRFSVHNGERIQFKVSAEVERYHAQVSRIRCGDVVNIGLRHTPVPGLLDRELAGRVQPVIAGSYVDLQPDPRYALDTFCMQALIWPTAPGLAEQVIMGSWDESDGLGVALLIDTEGRLAFRHGDGRQRYQVHSGCPLLERHWYLVSVSVDAASGRLRLAQLPQLRYPREDSLAFVEQQLDGLPRPMPRMRLAAAFDAGRARPEGARVAPYAPFNGKLEAPRICASVPDDDAFARLCADPRSSDDCITSFADSHWHEDAVVAAWDLALDISGDGVRDVSGNALHGRTVNMPTRAVRGVRWDGSVYDFRIDAGHYGAIHFHDDDLHDCGWATDFVVDVPDDLPSGLYCAHLSCARGEDWVPFVVSPPPGSARSPLALVLPSTSYWAYANRHGVIDFDGREQVRGSFTAADSTAIYLHHHPELGLSTYDKHRDGSGVCFSSRLRPILSIRPSEALWQLPADTHLIDWLNAQDIAFDVLSEDDVHEHGPALLRPYRCVMTGTHPEYPSLSVLDAFARFQQSGGRFIYTGGNGFYWRVSYHPDFPGIMEMRRAEDGIRAWIAEGGEYHHQLTGELGGMWRRMGRPPQSVAGTGMTAQGFDRSTSYSRTEASFDPRVAFVFEGIGDEEPIGDFGILGGGAAGWEIDRADFALGTPPHALVIAQASDFSSTYHWMKEELTHTHDAITGETCPHVHCDMVFYETDNGGAVFSTSSIAWAGALAHNDYQNNVSRIMRNVIERFTDPTPFT
ncbi:MAG: N,N-dimethylformamidase [Gammaproteobacteria bacterium]|nr:N,N-dimethylformamidase [Gammaproteobacteria bacterium]